MVASFLPMNSFACIDAKHNEAEFVGFAHGAPPVVGCVDLFVAHEHMVGVSPTTIV
jgi:hypothetical protein